MRNPGGLARVIDRPPRRSHEPKEDERMTLAAISARKSTDQRRADRARPLE